MARHATCSAALLMLLAVGGQAQADTWQQCFLDLRIAQVIKQPYPELQAEVLKVTPKPATAECPAVGELITFVPETADYQSPLVRRHWPKKGQPMKIRYQYLDGMCKGDGNDYACRIKHYPVSTHR